MATKRGNKFQARVKETGGKYHRYSFDTLAEAEAWEAQARAQKLSGTLIDKPNTFKENITFLDFYLNEETKLWNRLNRPKHMVTFVNDLYPDLYMKDLCYSHLVSIVEEYKKKKVKANTINHYLSRLKRVHDHAVDLGINPHVIRKWPWRSTKHIEARQKFLTNNEEEAIIQGFRDMNLHRYAEAFMFALDTGCRPSELFHSYKSATQQIGWDQISKLAGGNMSNLADPATGLPRAVVKLQSKTGTSSIRYIPLSPRVIEVLQWSAERGDVSPFQTGKRKINLVLYGKYLKLIREEYNLSDEIIAYSTRHTCASRLVQRGAPIANIMKWMGHTQISQTLAYAKLRNTDLLDMGALVGDTL